MTDEFRSLEIRAHRRSESGAVPLLAVVWPEDRRTLEAALRAHREGLVSVDLIGSDEQYDAVDAGGREIAFRPAESRREAMALALEAVERNPAVVLVSGCSQPGDFMDSLLDDTSAFRRPNQAISHVAVCRPAEYHKLLLVTDSMIPYAADLTTKLHLLHNAFAVAGGLGISDPRAAVLAAVEVVYPNMPVTIDAAVLAKMSDRRQIKGGLVDGPLSMDVAVDQEAARGKGLADSPVAGKADILLAPNVETANGIIKGLMLFGQGDTAGVIVGGRCPALAFGWVESVDTRYFSILAALALV